ncbi:uncharacterized protein LOC109856850 isoform X2 [Pseudomyrmex gracilis]|uniref:uncharacterized protein LOC109856850 isoform X2 n=1 Tax=Pseudomyrmex gracilis TaxID=219809 RepID=UPI000995208B|nr:uncharacterized protein LOC109856850 isoform X2 [Pseudomyrmex gracilis]
MGNYANKLMFRIHENQKENNETDCNVQTTPKLPQRRVLVDPRSITVGITRTPIEVNTPPLATTKKIPSAIPRHLQTKQFLETNLDVVMPPLSPKKPPLPRSITSNLSVESDEKRDNDYLTPKANVAKRGKKKFTSIDKERYRVLGLDPRSPAADFERTPILVSKSLALMKARSQEHLNRKGSYETDVYNPDSPGNLEISLSRSIPELFLNVASEIRTKLNLNQATEFDTIKSESNPSDDEIFESEEDEVTVINNPRFKKRQETTSISSEEETLTIVKDKIKKNDNYENIEIDITKNTRSNNSDNKIEVWHDSSSSEKELSVHLVIKQ